MSSGFALDFAPFNLRKLGAHMARPRHQKGWLKQERGQWVAHWYAYVRLEGGSEARRRRKRVVGPVGKLKRWQAEEKLAALVTGDPLTLSARPDSRVTLDFFYQNRFLPLATGRWRRSTGKSQPYVITKHILPKFGNIPLDRLTHFDVQTWLDAIGRQGQLSRAMLLKIRNLFHSILEEAIEQEYLERNPVTRVAVNGGKAKSERYLSIEEIGRLDQGLQGRERLVFRCLVMLGLRPGELFARRWQDWQGNRLMIQSAVYRGEVGDTKTQGSKGFVWLPKILQQDLGFYQLSERHTGPEDFIFSSRQGVPMDTHNFLRRVFKPLCEKLGVHGVTHQCLRRTCSTYLLPHGSVKDVQSHLRHASSRTTLDVYTKDIPQSVQAAVEEMAQLLFPAVPEGNGRVN